MIELLSIVIPQHWEPVLLASGISYAIGSFSYTMRRLGKIEQKVVRIETLLTLRTRNNDTGETLLD